VGQDGVATIHLPPQVLAAAADVADCAAGENGGKVCPPAGMPSDRPVGKDLNPGYPAAGDMDLKTTPDHLDLREFGHAQASATVGAVLFSSTAVAAVVTGCGSASRNFR
jgi:hypothetical protein